MKYFAPLLAVLATSFFCPAASAVGYADKTSYSVGGKKTTVRRERNLDHWDSDTLAYYLDDYRGHDVAIMFYAQWDRNSHALAPYWDRIATLLDAGNSKSRLIMSLFDCELNKAHSELCSVLNIEAYPTLMFVGSGPYHDTDPFTKTIFGKRSAGVMGEAPVQNTVKFQGNWQYGDAILDWIRTMQALSNWHLWTTQGFGRRLRTMFVPHKTPNKPLPVGVPRTGSTNTPPPPPADNAKTQALEQTVEALMNNTQQLEKLVMRSDAMMQNMLLPESDQDMFTIMMEHHIWDNSQKESASEEDLVMYTCVAQTALDYCQRVSKTVALSLITELEASGTPLEEMLKVPGLEQSILDKIGEKEPYCKLMDDCVVNSFEGKECRPETCPFTNEIACRHMTSCLVPEVQSAYADAISKLNA